MFKEWNPLEHWNEYLNEPEKSGHFQGTNILSFCTCILDSGKWHFLYKLQSVRELF